MNPLSVRHIRTFLEVQEHSSITGAARRLCRSQTSVTKSIQDLERSVDAPLFDRTAKGMSLTAYGEVLLPRAQEAAKAFSDARGLVPPLTVERSSGTQRFFSMDVSDKWIAAFLATADHQNIAAAAASLGVSTAAISSSVRKLEESLGLALFERVPNRVIASSFGKDLARYVKLALSYLRHAQDELLSLKGVRSGRVAIGTLPLLRTLIVPRAILRLIENHSYVDVSTLEGHYDALIAALRCGDIDFIVGALRGLPEGEELEEELLFDEYLSVIARKGHPLDNYESRFPAPACGSAGNEGGATSPQAKKCPRNAVARRRLRSTALNITRDPSGPASFARLPNQGRRVAFGSKKQVRWTDLTRYGWVLPRAGTPTRTLFEKAIFRRGLPVPEHVIETSSLVTLRGLLLESDRIAVLSRHQIHFDEQYGMLTALPFDLKEASRPLGITRRTHSTPSPAAVLLMQEIRMVVAELKTMP